MCRVEGKERSMSATCRFLHHDLQPNSHMVEVRYHSDSYWAGSLLAWTMIVDALHNIETFFQRHTFRLRGD